MRLYTSFVVTRSRIITYITACRNYYGNRGNSYMASIFAVEVFQQVNVCKCDSLISITRLTAAFMPVKRYEEMEEPKWTKDSLIDVLKMLTENDKGLLSYKSLCDIVGKSTVNSLIEYNILHLRPTSRLAFDVPIHANPIITAESPAAYVAMKEVLNEIDSCVK